MLNEDSDIGKTISSGVILMTMVSGVVGSLCLIIGGIATWVNLPLIGRVHYLHGPTGSGIVYILAAVFSLVIIYYRYFLLLYLTGGIAGLAAGYDILNGTSLGYVIQMVLGSGGAMSMSGGTTDPVVAGMMAQGGFSLPTAWMIIAAGIFLIIMTPQFAEATKKKEEAAPKKPSTDEKIRSINRIMAMYKRGDITREEAIALKRELMEGKKR